MKLTNSLNHAIAVSLKRNPNSRNSQFVRAIILVKGVHFYGFHSSYSPFLKVLFADPTVVTRAVSLLQAGAIMKTRFRVYESHFSYILQFMSDFGLYGCGWIDLAETWQRDTQEPVPGEDNEHSHQEAIQTDIPLRRSPYYRQTRMPLEIDVAAHQILNRHLLSPRNIHHKLTIPAPDLPQEPVVLSVRELWEDERKRRAARGLSPSPVLPVDPSAGSRAPGGGWAAEARWWDEIRKRVERERGDEPEQSPSQSWVRWVMTTFESVEALWEPEWKVWKPTPREPDEQEEAVPAQEDNPYGTSAVDGLPSQEMNATSEAESDIDVDETLLFSQDVSRAIAQDAAEWERQDDQREGDSGEPIEDAPPPEAQDEDSGSLPPSPERYVT